MNFAIIFYILGSVIKIEGILMLLDRKSVV